MKTAFSTKENKSPGDVRSHWSLQKLMSSATRSLFIEASLLQRCEEHNVLMMKDACAARRNPSHNRSTSPPSLATLDTINQRFATGTKKRPLAGYCLFAKYDLFSADTGLIIAIALSCPVVSHLINQGIFCKPS